MSNTEETLKQLITIYLHKRHTCFYENICEHFLFEYFNDYINKPNNNFYKNVKDEITTLTPLNIFELCKMTNDYLKDFDKNIGDYFDNEEKFYNIIAYCYMATKVEENE